LRAINSSGVKRPASESGPSLRWSSETIVHPSIRYTFGPNTTNTWPDTSAAASLARNTTMGAMLSGSHSGPVMYSAPSAIVEVIRVLARGAMQFAVTPYFRSSRASTRVSERMPPLAAE
jgi:hypothetical protein